MQNDVLTVAKGHTPILPTTATVTGFAGIILKYLEVVNSIAGFVMVLTGIIGGYWLYRKNRSEALKADAETDRIKLENEQKRIELHERQIQLEAQEIEQRLEKSTVKLVEKIVERIEVKHEVDLHKSSSNNAS